MLTNIRARPALLLLMGAMLFVVGCFSTTAPPVVPAPETQEPEKSTDKEPIAKSEENKLPADDVSPVVPNPPSSPPSEVANATPPDGANPVEGKPVESKPEEIAKDAASSNGDPAGNTVAEPAIAPAGDAPKTLTGKREDAMRLIAFAPAGPMVIDLVVYLDGESLGAKRTAAIDRIFAQLDEDNDSRISWEQFLAHPRVKSGLYGNAPVADDVKVDDMLEKYDVSKNGRVDKDELPRFFSDDRGATKAFSILAPARPIGSPGEDSMILAWLDTDGDGQLSKEELAETRSQLRIRDADDDRVLSASELMPQAQGNMPGMMPMRRPSSGPPSGMLLGPSPRWEALSYYLEEIYAGAGKKLRTSHFPGTEQLANFVDGNKDGKITPIELQNLQDIPADLTLTLRYVSKRTADSEGPKLEAAPLARDWEKYQSAWKQNDLRAQFTADEYSIAFSMNDLVGVASQMEVAKSLFDQADADKNGYLEEKEFTMPQIVGGLTFAQVDENGDGKVYLDEVEKIAGERQIVAGTQAVIKIEVTGDPFLSVLDRDGDGRLSDREMREAEQNLLALDKDQDGLVGIGELPQSMKISVIRGIVGDGTVIPDSPVIMASTTPSDAPLWFSKMDINGDGELNEIEFIGTPEQFATLDKNQDGTINLSEAAPPKTEPAPVATEAAATAP
jgi:Ca2+-binding EF-hand superfamily protein